MRRKIIGGIYEERRDGTNVVTHDTLSCGHDVPVPKDATGLEEMAWCDKCAALRKETKS